MNRSDASEGSPLESDRRRVVDLLCAKFAEDVLTVDEFERRVDVAQRAESREELAALLSDLPAPPPPMVSERRGTGPAPRPAARPVPLGGGPGPVKERALMVGCLGGTKRTGRWVPAQRNFALACMGGVHLDFRDASLPAGVTEVTAVALMGGVEIIVPPGVHVDTGGIALLGGFEHTGDGGAESAHPDAPVIRVSGVAIMGGVQVVERFPGETGSDARRRRRAFRRARRKGLPPPE